MWWQGFKAFTRERRNAMRDYTTGGTEGAILLRQAQAGDPSSLAQLITDNERLVHHLVRRQWRGTLAYAEAVQAGRIGLWRAILGFDPARGTSFSTYASVAIVRHVWRAVDETEKWTAEVAWQPQPDPGADPLTILLAAEVNAALHALVDELPHRQRWVIRRYYGLDGQGGGTLEQLGRQQGCSHQAIHAHRCRAIDRLRLRVKDADMTLLRRGRPSRQQLLAQRRTRLRRRARRRGYG
jgi:RNA polymerase sigma factor (sigma-70 family)